MIYCGSANISKIKMTLNVVNRNITKEGTRKEGKIKINRINENG